MDEDRMYATVWAFFLVSSAAVFVALISIAEGVPVWPPIVCASVIAAVGYPCAVLVVWGDGIGNIIDSILNLFKRKRAE
jgi:hypothetical protein